MVWSDNLQNPVKVLIDFFAKLGREYEQWALAFLSFHALRMALEHLVQRSGVELPLLWQITHRLRVVEMLVCSFVFAQKGNLPVLTTHHTP
jgi:hypothetical protein